MGDTLARLRGVAPSAAVMPAARHIVAECLHVAASETLLLVAEDAFVELAAAVLAVASDRGALVVPILLEAAEAGPNVVRRLERAEAGCQASVLLGSVDMPSDTRKVLAETMGPGRRHAHVIGLTAAVVRQGLRADTRELAHVGQRLMGRVRPGSTIRVTSPGGSDLVFELHPDHRWSTQYGVLAPGEWMNLPAGTTITTPAAVDGVLVPDGGVCLDGRAAPPLAGGRRLRLELAGGRLVAAEGPTAAVDALNAAVDLDPDGRRVGQLIFGTNLSVLAPIGVTSQDLVLPGVHLGLGYTDPAQTGARWTSAVQVNLMQRRVDAWIDDVQVLAGGRYTAELLDGEPARQRRAR